MAHWKSIVRLVIVFGVVGILGRLTFADSGPATGLVRGVCIGILGIIALWYMSKWEEELQDISSFEPFTVAIQPTRAALLDHGLATAEQLDNLDWPVLWVNCRPDCSAELATLKGRMQ